METKPEPTEGEPRIKSDDQRGERGPTFAEPEQIIADLSSEIIATIDRAPGQRVTCRRILGNNYRCNWWAPQHTAGFDNPTMSGLTVTTHRVVRSHMLRITKTREGLVIQTLGDTR